MKENKLKAIKCPRCSNYIKAIKDKKGVYNGCCLICKVRISTKQISSKETSIRVLTL